MLPKLTGILKRAVRRARGYADRRTRRNYAEMDYLEAYSLDTDRRVGKDPHHAIGGLWEEIGRLQFDFMLRRGMQPSHSMLDFGCGTLRGGRHFIRYLDEGRYTGVDISPKAIEFARELVAREGLAGKSPQLVVTGRHGLRFADLPGRTFDFVLAQSVFTHLTPELIEEFLAHVGPVLGPTGALYYTYGESAGFERSTLKDFRYPRSWMREVTGKHGLSFEDLSADYAHPRGQRMVCARLRAG
jgi:SAM-dependent methyltransferase